MEALSYRSLQELAAANEQRSFEQDQLLATRTELLQAEVEKVIDTFFDEAYQYAAYAHDHPMASINVGRNVLVAVFLVLTLFEICNVALLVAKRLSGASYLSKVVRLGATPWWSVGGARVAHPTTSCDTGLSWSAATKHRLQLSLRAVSVAIVNGLPLPNVLVTGPAGSGKSSMGRVVLENMAQAAASSGARLSSLVVCGADLQALGNGGATDFLSNLICKYVNQSGKREALVLVVDDADSIIAARGGGGGQQQQQQQQQQGLEATSQGGGCYSGSLFALLTGLRDNSPFVSVVLTSRLAVNAVDVAILDR
jgi:hypothetical protein